MIPERLPDSLKRPKLCKCAQSLENVSILTLRQCYDGFTYWTRDRAGRIGNGSLAIL